MLLYDKWSFSLGETFQYYLSNQNTFDATQLDTPSFTYRYYNYLDTQLAPSVTLTIGRFETGVIGSFGFRLYSHRRNDLGILMRQITVLLLCFGLGSPLAFALESISGPTVSQSEGALYEIGVFGGGAYLPDYPAANQSHLKGLMMPYIIYRGSILRADREGARARLARTRLFDVEISFSGAFRTNSANNEARRGMPDLDYMGEIGPRLSFRLSNLGGYGRLNLFVPARIVVSTNFENIRHRGYTLAPALYARLWDFLRPGWFGIAQITATFTDRQNAAYFYDVAPEFALPDRPYYVARAGYMGSDFLAGLLIPIGSRWRLFVGGQFLDHDGSANSASPLFKQRINGAAILGLSYMFIQSKQSALER